MILLFLKQKRKGKKGIQQRRRERVTESLKVNEGIMKTTNLNVEPGCGIVLLSSCPQARKRKCLPLISGREGRVETVVFLTL